MTPSTSYISRLIRSFIGLLLDRITFLDYITSTQVTSKACNSNVSVAVDSLSSRRIAIFATYYNGLDLSSILQVTKELQQNNFQILIVNTGTYLPTIPSVPIYNRENLGRDIASYAIGTKLLFSKLINCDEVLYLNDSVNWLPSALSKFVKKANQNSAQITGVSESFQRSFHIQTFALHIKNPTNEILKLVESQRLLRNKRSVVKYGERGLTRAFLQAGLKVGGLFQVPKTVDSLIMYRDTYGADWEKIRLLVNRGVHLNPSIHTWPLLLENYGLYKNILRQNPAKFSQSPTETSFFKSKIHSGGTIAGVNPTEKIAKNS